MHPWLQDSIPFSLLTFVLLGSKLYDSSSVGEFLAHTFHTGDSLLILLSVWASYSPRESPGMPAAQSFDYDTRNKTLTNKAAQNRQCSIQSVSVDGKKTYVWGPFSSPRAQHGNRHQSSVTISRLTLTQKKYCEGRGFEKK